MDFERFSYTSAVDKQEDWYLFHAGSNPICVIYLHGHGSHGDQLVTRADIAPRQVFLEALGVSVLSPNLRDNAWMSQAAVEDLTTLLTELQAKHHWKRIVIDSGSMGGTGALIYAMRHPELIDGIVVLGAATSLATYVEWCAAPGRLPVVYEIHDAIVQAYPTPEALAAHDVCAHCDQLTMPVFYSHGAADELIPPSEAANLAAQMAGKPNFHLTMVPDGNHDSPLPNFCPDLARLFEALGEPIPEKARQML